MRISDWSSDVCSSDLEDRTVSRDELPFEFLMNALRLNDGFAVRDYAARTGLDWSQLAAAQTARERGLIAEQGSHVRQTETGPRHQIGRASGRGRVWQYV